MAYKRRLKFDKRIRFQKQMNIIYILLFVVLASVGVGYAYISTQLNISGTANVTAARWDVHFENLQVTSGSVTASSPASITGDTTVEFAVTLDEPNDFYEFTVDIVNDGTMEAMIDSFSISPTLTATQQNYLAYIITYEDGADIANKQKLEAASTETIRVIFKYINTYDSTLYPTTDQSFNVEFTVDYIQADGSKISINHPQTIYTANVDGGNYSNVIYMNQAIPSHITKYTTPEAALSFLRTTFEVSDFPIYLRHTVKNDIVVESYVNFVISNAMAQANPGMTAGTYSLKSDFGSLFHSSSEEIFETNKSTLLTAFGSNNCSPDGDDIMCNAGGISINSANGYFVQPKFRDYACSVYTDGKSYCCYIS